MSQFDACKPCAYSFGANDGVKLLEDMDKKWSSSKAKCVLHCCVF
jgi:hypothetical protein